MIKTLTKKILRAIWRKKALKIGTTALVSLCSPFPILTFIGIEALEILF